MLASMKESERGVCLVVAVGALALLIYVLAVSFSAARSEDVQTRVRAAALVAMDHDALILLARETGSAGWERIERLSYVTVPEDADLERGVEVQVRATYCPELDRPRRPMEWPGGRELRASVWVCSSPPAWRVTWLANGR